MSGPFVVNTDEMGTTKTVARAPGTVPADLPPVMSLVIQGFEERRKFGMAKYGVELTGFDNNDPLREAIQEAQDLVVYLHQMLYERNLGNPLYIAPWYLIARMVADHTGRVESPEVWDEAQTWLEATVPASIRGPLGI